MTRNVRHFEDHASPMAGQALSRLAGSAPVAPLAMWGGLECTVNRVRDRYFTQLDRNGHHRRDDDIERFAALGIRAIRYPVLWERTAPDGIDSADWRWPTAACRRCASLGITPIVGLVHHGSGPRHTSLLDPGFATGLAEFAGAVAARYPWVEHYTPVNEPLTTARFSALYGLWYPHARDDRTFVAALLNQCRAIVLSMRAIRRVNPDAQLVQTDDLGKTYGTGRWPTWPTSTTSAAGSRWDLLCGRVDRAPSALGLPASTAAPSPEDILWFPDNPCPPDIIGVNYYVTSERWLDHRLERYPGRARGGPPRPPLRRHRVGPRAGHADAGIAPLLRETWDRYGICRWRSPRRTSTPTAKTSCAGCSRSGTPRDRRARRRRRRARGDGLVAARLLRLELPGHRVPRLLRARAVRRARAASRAPTALAALIASWPAAARRPTRCCRARAGGAGRTASWSSRSRRAPR